ncbi:MAG: hypothetical protein IKD85_00565 [Firmicutes bacterium]|nr:hypothetical protein [Bacillota bacterium]
MKNRFKKLPALVLALVLASAMLPAAVYAAPPTTGSDGHLHRWKEVERHDATCTEEGYILYECGDPSCEESPYREVTAAALGHSWDGGTVTQEATCTAEGVKTYTCTRCGEKRTESIPKKEHTVAALPGKAATCTENGLTDGQQCSACGQIITVQTEIPATGHRWDSGTVTKEPDGLAGDGEILYTCLNDPSHTRTETVSAASAMFSMLRLTPKNYPPDSSLKIVTQPEGGSIVRYGSGKGSHKFIVEAEGGSGAYSYEWHSVDEEKAAAMVAATAITEGSAATKIEGLIATAAGGKAGKHDDFINSWKDVFPSVEGVELPDLQEFQEVKPAVFNPGDRVVSHSVTLTTTGGGLTYYCIVSDESGAWVESDHVKLTYDLSISEQPENCNAKDTENPGLKTLAVDGTPPYSYDWFHADDDTPVAEDAHNPFLVPDSYGEYYCIVSDDAGQSAKSNAAFYYEAETLTITDVWMSAGSIIDGEETVDMEVYISGGVAPYSAHYVSTNSGWTDVEAEENTDPAHEGEFHFSYSADVADEYLFEVEDAMGRHLSTRLPLPYKQLKIKRQLWYHVIEGSENRMLDMELEEGEGPITYELYRIEPGWDEYGFTDGLLADSWTDDSLIVKHEVEDSGLYYIIATDSTGRWARSETISVEVVYVRMYACTSYVQVENDSRAAVLQAKVTGKSVTGIDEITFDWYRLDGKGGSMQPIDQTDPYVSVLYNVNFFTEGDVTGLENRIAVTMPGYYTCIVSDRDGHMAASGNMRVNYIGCDPYFVIQPQSVRIPGSSTTHPTATLTCEAVPGDEPYQSDEGRIVYNWSRYQDGHWKAISINSADTNTLELVQEDPGAIDNFGTLPVISGRFRCEAFDLQTGRHSYSDAVYVEHTLEYGYYSARINWNGTADIRWGFYGGVTPYNIKVYTERWVCTNKKSNTWELRTEEVPLKKGWYSLEEEEGKMTLIIYSVPSYKWRGDSGQPYPAKYTIRVTSGGKTIYHDVEFTLAGTSTGTVR